MITAGVDVGTRFLKIALVEGTMMLGCAISELKGDFQGNFNKTFSTALKEAGIKKSYINKSIATGYGAGLVKKAAYTLQEGACITRACSASTAVIRSVIDAGGLFIKVITIDESGFMEQSHINEKCASGSGRFLEMISESLHIPFEDISETAAAAKNPYRASNSCAVFTESEIISQINTGRDRGDIIAGVMDSIVSKTVTLYHEAGATGPLALTGGLTCIPYYKIKLSGAIKAEIIDLPLDPQIIPAYGAAILAQGGPVNKRERTENRHGKL